MIALEMHFAGWRRAPTPSGLPERSLLLAGHMLKHIEAIMLLKETDGAIEIRKARVKASAKWLEAAQEAAKAAGEFEKLTAAREAAASRIEAWRSEMATLRVGHQVR